MRSNIVLFTLLVIIIILSGCLDFGSYRINADLDTRIIQIQFDNCIMDTTSKKYEYNDTAKKVITHREILNKIYTVSTLSPGT